MIQIRIHGRGGQGVVSAAEILSIAAFAEGKHAQAFPSFGSERMGAPVTAFCRIDDKSIQLREPISAPDALIVQDPTLLTQPELFKGLTPNGYVVLNSAKPLRSLPIAGIVNGMLPGHIIELPATQIAREHIGRPLPNAAMLAALVALTGILKLSSICDAISKKFPPAIAEKNHKAATAAYDYVKAALKTGHLVVDGSTVNSAVQHV
jgi:pyruvate ferredoxin oxidoreductase gamma subunit